MFGRGFDRSKIHFLNQSEYVHQESMFEVFSLFDDRYSSNTTALFEVISVLSSLFTKT